MFSTDYTIYECHAAKQRFLSAFVAAPTRLRTLVRKVPSSRQKEPIIDSSVLWRVSKQIQTKGYAGTARLAQIDKFHDPQRNSSNADGSYAKKAKREDDMVSSGHGMYRFAFI